MMLKFINNEEVQQVQIGFEQYEEKKSSKNPQDALEGSELCHPDKIKESLKINSEIDMPSG